MSKRPMFARIQSDGGFHTTVTPEGGEPLKGLSEIVFVAATGQVPQAQVTLGSVKFEGLAHLRFLVTDPDTGEGKEVAKILFADGTEWAAP